MLSKNIINKTTVNKKVAMADMNVCGTESEKAKRNVTWLRFLSWYILILLNLIINYILRISWKQILFAHSKNWRIYWTYNIKSYVMDVVTFFVTERAEWKLKLSRDGERSDGRLAFPLHRHRRLLTPMARKEFDLKSWESLARRG